MASDVELLIQKGVPTTSIKLVGFSRGAAITMLTAKLLANNSLTIIILAACGQYLKHDTELTRYGHIYSIFETSDKVGSCQFLIDRCNNVQSFTELSISTDKAHSAFYAPLPEWVEPVKKWLKLNHRKKVIK